MTQRIQLIKDKLTAVLHPTQLQVIDDSAKHIGHAGAKDGRGHFKVIIVSDDFIGKSAIKRHQMVYQALGGLMQTDIHALQIEAKTVAEMASATF